MKIQYMSDLHFEFRENSRYIKHNEFPVTGDILVLAGDIFYLKDKVSPLSRFWKWASENYRQVLIIPGNHEYYSGIQQWLPVFQRLGMHVLMNENTQIRVNGTPLAIAGVTDTAALNWGLEGPDPEKALSGLSKDIAKIMLSHRPSLAPESAKAGASLQLSGHTHGGQIFPFHIFAKLHNKYLSGLYPMPGGAEIYVSNGAGQWGPQMRFLAPSEITVLKLTPEK